MPGWHAERLARLDDDRVPRRVDGQHAVEDVEHLLVLGMGVKAPRHPFARRDRVDVEAERLDAERLVDFLLRRRGVRRVREVVDVDRAVGHTRPTRPSGLRLRPLDERQDVPVGLADADAAVDPFGVGVGRDGPGGRRGIVRDEAQVDVDAAPRVGDA